MKFKCPLCNKNWKEGQESIQCCTCNQWVHHNNRKKCSLLTNKDFTSHKNNECDAVNFPFNNINENDFSVNDTVSDDVSLVLNQDVTKFMVACDKITSNINNDEDCNLPQMID